VGCRQGVDKTGWSRWLALGNLDETERGWGPNDPARGSVTPENKNAG